jgi:hypothetical protein
MLASPMPTGLPIVRLASMLAVTPKPSQLDEWRVFLVRHGEFLGNLDERAYS